MFFSVEIVNQEGIYMSNGGIFLHLNVQTWEPQVFRS